MARFEEAYEGWTESRLTQDEAARLLGGCARTFRRWLDRYQEEGMAGLLDKRLGQGAGRCAPVDEVLALVNRYGHEHRGWNVKHFYAWYRRDGGGRIRRCGWRSATGRGNWPGTIAAASC